MTLKRSLNIIVALFIFMLIRRKTHKQKHNYLSLLSCMIDTYFYCSIASGITKLGQQTEHSFHFISFHKSKNLLGRFLFSDYFVFFSFTAFKSSADNEKSNLDRDFYDF